MLFLLSFCCFCCPFVVYGCPFVVYGCRLIIFLLKRLSHYIPFILNEMSTFNVCIKTRWCECRQAVQQYEPQQHLQEEATLSARATQ